MPNLDSLHRPGARSGDHAPGQAAPRNGYDNLEVMLKGVVRRGAEVGACASCMEAQGMTPEELAEGTKKSSLEELAGWTQWADKVMVY